MDYIFDEADPLFDRQSTLNFQRLSVSCRSAGGWTIGERFDDRFNTEVGGFSTIAKQWLDESGQMQGDWSRLPNGEIETHRITSVIVDYENEGKRYSDDEADGLPEFHSVLTRLREREKSYIQFLEEKEAAKQRFETRKRLYTEELHKRGVRFLPIQVMRPILKAAGI